MQLNQGWFLANGRCGYVLQPEYMKQPNYNPFNKHTIVGVDPVTVTITVGHFWKHFASFGLNVLLELLSVM